MYWLIRKVWLPVLCQILWWGWTSIDPPPATRIILTALAAVALAGAGRYLVYSTHHIDPAYRVAEIFVLTTAWFGAFAIVILTTLNTPDVGLVGGAFFLYAALDGFPKIRAWIADVGGRIIRKIRYEDAALRRDDPNWKPAVVPPVWGRRRNRHPEA